MGCSGSPGGSRRTGDLHRGSRDQARAQDRGAGLRRPQRTCGPRPRQRDHHRHHGDRGRVVHQNQFGIDLEQDSVTCPAGHSAPIRRGADGTGAPSFGDACTGCPLREQCTKSAGGRSISIGAHEQQLAAARTGRRDPDWVADYRATRPKVERKIGHLMRRRHGGRRARVRGQSKVAADFALLAAVNLARLGVLAVASTPNRGWATADRPVRAETPYTAADCGHHDAIDTPTRAQQHRSQITLKRAQAPRHPPIGTHRRQRSPLRQSFDTSHPVRLRL